MNPHESPSAREAAIEHQAAAWLARRDRGLTAPEQDDLLQWLADDPRHGEWFSRHQQTVRSLRHLAQWRPEHATRPNPDLLAQLPARKRRPARWRWAAGLAAAAGLALATGWWGQPDTAARIPAVAETTAPGEESVLRRLLEDGSTIDLNRGAQIEVSFTAAERRVRLVRGEAHFTVANNPARPFVVHAEGVEVRAVGTAFDVKLATGSVEVLVTEGRVRVQGPATAPQPEAPLVNAGEQAVVLLAEPSAPPRITAVPPATVARLLAWQPRQLEFTDAPLAQVVAELNRDNHVRLVIADPALAALPIGATLRSDNVEGFVRLLESSFHVMVERRADGVIVLRDAGTGLER